MKRVDTAHKVTDANGAGKDGFGPGASGVTAATEVDDTWLNAVQEEIANAVELAGLTLDADDPTQLAAAFRALSAIYTVSGTATTIGAAFPLTPVAVDTGFSEASGIVTVPFKGLYLVTFMGLFTCTTVTNPLLLSVADTGANYPAAARRYSGTAGETVGISGSYVKKITVPGSDPISLASNTGNMTASSGNLSITLLRRDA